MKNTILHWTSVLLASSALMLSACSSSDEESGPSVPPVFPDEIAELTIFAGETSCNLTFTPNLDWTVSLPIDGETSRWFKLSDGVMESSSISGYASSEPVTIQVTTTNENVYDEEPTCEVMLTMGGQTQVIAKITRTNASREFDLYLSKYDTDGDDFIMPYEFEETPLAQFDGTEAPATAPEGTAELKWPVRVGEYMQVLKSTSNFDWLASTPDWLDVSSPTDIEGETNSKQFFVSVLFDKLTEEQLDGAVGLIDFYDAEIDKIENPSEDAHNRYCFSLPALRNVVRHRTSAMNGTTFSFTKEGQQVDTNGTVLEDTPCTGDVYSAAGLKFYVAVQDDRGFYYTGMNFNTQENMTDWVTIEDTWNENGSAFQQHTYTVSVTENTGKSREAILIALPKAMADQITNPDNQLFNMDGTELLDEYKPYQFATVEQEGSGDESGESDEFLYYNPDMADRFTGPDAIATLTKLIPGENEQFFFDNEQVSPVADLLASGIYDYFAQGTLPIYTLNCTADLMQSGDFDESSGSVKGSIIVSNGYDNLQVMPDNYASWITYGDFDLDASHRTLLISTGADNAAPKGSIAAFVFKKEYYPGAGFYQNVCILFVIRDYGTESANQ